MTARTQPANWPQPRSEAEGAVLVWLDALAGGICTPEAFLNAVHEQTQGDSDESWEVLSLLDQYYRRGKIKAEVFHTLKSRLEGSALNPDQEVSAGPQPHASTAVSPSTVVPPTAVPAIGTSPSVTAPATTPARKASPATRPAVREVRREVAIGDVLRGRYRILAVLGHGGMGTVFDALDEYRLDLPTSGQRIAIKVLHTVVTQRDELLAELQREFQHLQLLSHPNIVRVHEFDRDGDSAFFTMESLSGVLLSHVMGARKALALPRPYALAVMREVGAALAHAHSRGVVHGDINPQNIFITNDGELRVLDFGASHKLLRDAGLSQRAPVATPGYASCQLLEGQHPDARDDLFAFACVAYVLLSGQHPFPRRTAVDARAQRVRPSRPPGLTGRQWRVLREGLRWERDRRPADIQKWLYRFGLGAAAPRLPPLAALMNAPTPRNSGGARTAAIIALFAALAAGGYWTATNHDSLARLVKPATPTPVAARQASRAPIIESAPVPQENPSPAPASTAGAATAAAARAAAAPIATRPGAAAAPARRFAGESSAGAGNAGPVRIEMAADAVDVEPTDREALVTVRRRGSLHGDASFTWWTESGTAKPGRDFAPVILSVEHIADGRGHVTLNVPIFSTPRGKSKSFFVAIDQTGPGGTALGARTVTMVTIQPAD
jgi:serine/threonine protein kinase